MSTAPDTDKQTNLIHEYSVHGKMTEILEPAQYWSYQKLAESKVLSKFEIKGTSFSDTFGSEQN